jgi:hypothetical protein
LKLHLEEMSRNSGQNKKVTAPSKEHGCDAFELDQVLQGIQRDLALAPPEFRAAHPALCTKIAAWMDEAHSALEGMRLTSGAPSPTAKSLKRTKALHKQAVDVMNQWRLAQECFSQGIELRKLAEALQTRFDAWVPELTHEMPIFADQMRGYVETWINCAREPGGGSREGLLDLGLSLRSKLDLAGEARVLLSDCQRLLGSRWLPSADRDRVRGNARKLIKTAEVTGENGIESFCAKLRAWKAASDKMLADERRNAAIALIGFVGAATGGLWLPNYTPLLLLAIVLGGLGWFVGSEGGDESSLWGMSFGFALVPLAFGLLVLGCDWLLGLFSDSWSLSALFPMWLRSVINGFFGSVFTLAYAVLMCCLILRLFLHVFGNREADLGRRHPSF